MLEVLDSWFGPETIVKFLKEGGVILSTRLAFSTLNLICRRSFLPIFLLGHSTENFTCALEFFAKKIAARKKKRKKIILNRDRKIRTISSAKDELQKYLEMNLKKG